MPTGTPPPAPGTPPAPKPPADLWAAVAAALQRARGRNAYRGKALLQPAQRRIVLEFELRANCRLTGRVPSLLLHVGSTPDQVWYALPAPPHRPIRLSAAADLDAFIDDLAAELRGGTPHLRTYLHRTEYKP